MKNLDYTRLNLDSVKTYVKSWKDQNFGSDKELVKEAKEFFDPDNESKGKVENEIKDIIQSQ